MEKKVLKIYEGFAGKGTFSSAIKEIGVQLQTVGYCEKDKYASTAFAVVHNVSEDINDWDITTVNPKSLPDFDIYAHGSPCTSFSIAGKKDGGDEGSGTESSLMWYSVEIIKEKKPKYVLWENVSDVLNDKNKHNFDKYINQLNESGYNSYWKVQNSLDFGIPQKRKRIYVYSIRKDVDDNNFEFVEPKLFNPLISILEENPPIDLYLDESHLQKVKETASIGENYIQYDLTNKGHKSQDQRAFYPDNYHGTLPSTGGGSKCKVVEIVDVLEEDAELPFFSNIYGGFGETKPRVHEEYSPTIRTAKGGGHIPSVKLKDTYSGSNDRELLYNGKVIRIRALTSLECFRLMDESDENYYKIKEAINNKHYKGKDKANTQLYRIAGNSIVKRVLKENFKVLFKDYIQDIV